MLPFDLLLITEAAAPTKLPARVAAALVGVPAGRVAVQLRDPARSEGELEGEALALREITRRAGVLFFVNAHLDLARRVEADGVQLPERGESVAIARQALARQALVGVSVHDAVGLAKASRDGADFALVSPVYKVPGKGPALGTAGLADLVLRASLPVVALGGIDPARTSDVLHCGVAAIAAIRSVWDHTNPAKAVAGLLEAIDAHRATARS